ncbi:MAG: PEFG-CTERM sorting domain-containing protein [Nitrosopumilaceae archaeon]|nr:PEFG-CTERM sorting domain-containing protein [Nitrosopumilaceae archaeon]
MERVEVMMREELRSMIKQGAPASEVSDQIDAILVEMETVAVIVPEFGVMASVVLAAAVALVLVLSMRSRRIASISILPTRTA